MVYVRSPSELAAYDGDFSRTAVFTISFLTDGRKLDNWTFSVERSDDLVVWMTLLTKVREFFQKNKTLTDFYFSVLFKAKLPICAKYVS